MGVYTIPAYDEAQMVAAIRAVEAVYAEAGVLPNLGAVVWVTRIQYDYVTGMAWEDSVAKHLNEVRAELGLPVVAPIPPPTLETLPPLVVDGHVFKQDGGVSWTAIQCSDFNLLNRWQHGEDITPILAQRRDAGFNLLRVWTLYNLAASNIGVFLDIDYSRVPAFVRLCASYGLYVEFTAYASTERVSHWADLVAACGAFLKGAVLVELVNEGTLAVNQIDMARYGRPTNVMCSHGSGGAEGIPPWEPWDYTTFHTNGASEEQRKIGHNAMEDLANVFHVPALTNETSRYPDVGMWRSGDPTALAFDAAAGAALLCAGSCFHSVAGKASVLWDAATEKVARAWAAGARSVPVSMQHEPYRRRDDLLTSDLLRVYQRGIAIVSIRK